MTPSRNVRYFFMSRNREKGDAMREIINESNLRPHTEHREVQIGKTIYQVSTVFKGQQTLEEVLREWVVNKALATANN